MSLYLQQSGCTDKPAIVLLHGWGMHSDVWLSWLPMLENYYSVIRLDLPGLGRSADHFPASYSLNSVSAMVHERILAEVEHPVIWLGWSLGGLVAAQIVADNPTCARGLVTIATTPCFVQRPDFKEAMDSQVFQQFQQGLERSWLKTLNRFLMLMVQGGAQSRQTIKVLKQLLGLYQTIEPRCLSEALALLNQDYRGLYRRVSVPRLQLFADSDGLVPNEVARRPEVAEYASIIANSSHVPFLAQPQSCIEKIVQFENSLKLQSEAI
ncbi:alpha/beta fold hydrolase [Motiliproteus sp. MSK22-1]|uniref:alpha/beta fold hydrolase n=1 Tax=Motiliproteus sp. MSK22-1 TaxID=1897630 RepID=UPI000975DCE4|nr:alpha/beta fold hydrolase [Motiliproteus sp. MSK22-1]OMH38226.1 hypothetical protein BGP75_08215 [Motiliproteus sp. MSK22-1]